MENDIDMMNHPTHYTGSVERIDAFRASMGDEAYEGFLKGQVMKYMWRYEKKRKPAEGLAKAEWYLRRLIAPVSEICRARLYEHENPQLSRKRRRSSYICSYLLDTGRSVIYLRLA